MTLRVLRWSTFLLVPALVTACAESSGGGVEGTPGTGGGGAQATATATNSADASSTGTGEDAYPGCLDRDPSARFEMQLTLSTWAPNQGSISATLAAECSVESFDRNDVVLTFQLTCPDELLGTTIVDGRLEVPRDTGPALVPGATVRLDLAAHGMTGEAGNGMVFAIHRTEDHELLLAGYDEEFWHQLASTWTPALAPWAASLDTSICRKTCSGEASPQCDAGNSGYVWRQGISISDGNETVSVLDGRRGVIASAGVTYDIVVPVAGGEAAISPDFQYRALIARRD